MTDLKQSLDAVLQGTVSGAPRVPGVVAMVTDRNGDIYSGAAGERVIGGAPMTEDTVFAIFSTTKAIAATAALQCVEEGLLDLDAPARDYAPAIGKLQVIDGFDGAGQPILRAPASAFASPSAVVERSSLSVTSSAVKSVPLAIRASMRSWALVRHSGPSGLTVMAWEASAASMPSWAARRPSLAVCSRSRGLT